MLAAPSSRPERALALLPRSPVEVDLCGIHLSRRTEAEVLALLEDRLAPLGSVQPSPPLAIGSVNLDHVHHFGRRDHPAPLGSTGRAEWLMLADGSPISLRASLVSGTTWPRLAGADLLPAALDVARASGARVGFLGGTASSVRALGTALDERWPGLRVAGCWTPARAELVERQASRRVAAAIDHAGVDLLVVGLGKPLQERWIDLHADHTGARVLVAFGGAADFLGGTTRRAPQWVRSAGCEWVFRLATEPRRLSRRYLVQGPRALARLLADQPRWITH